MAEIIAMPDLGFEAGEGELSVWLKSVGDEIQAGEPIAEFESDKVTLEVEASAAGVLLELLIQPGQSAPAGAPIARVGEAHELSSPPSPAPTQEPSPPPVAPPEAETPSDPLPAVPPEKQPARHLSREPIENGVLATPIALRMAREHNLDLRRVAGSGPGGRILRGDVENLLAQARPDAIADVDHRLPAASDKSRATGTAASPLRRTIAQRMSRSKQTIPHFYITSSVTMDDALALRKQINDALPADEQVTVNDMVMKATALALRDFPNLNASYVDDRIEFHTDINIGAAVAVEGGVLTVVNRQTDQRNIDEIAHANRSMIQRARAGKVRTRGCNRQHLHHQQPRRLRHRSLRRHHQPAPSRDPGGGHRQRDRGRGDGLVVVRTVMQMTISADHRVTDGAECAVFLQRVKELLETPIRLFLT